MSLHKPNVQIMRAWQLASINHLEDLESNGSVLKDVPPDGEEAMVCIAAIMSDEKATAFCELISALLRDALDQEEVQISAPIPFSETTH